MADDPRLAKAREAYWQNPDDTAALLIWADVLTELGDLRGEFIQLSSYAELEPKRLSRYLALKKQGPKMVGPARPFFTTFDFSPNGLVSKAECRGEQLVEGFEHIVWLNPRLHLQVNGLHRASKATLAAMAKLPLGRIQELWLPGLEKEKLAPLTEVIQLTRPGP